ncbi:MAG: 16S rRNA (guanine(966)-N(2))-methyltransferase RsmD [Burkholderiales bacterium]|jgi:16S rRNA (guanine(966)-N(2))-methyltransferase RsmD|nr:16S rRNA (guanine(966)-N(2))-methyltransferase RsmD [Burkholderiales bacterium]
MGASATRKNEVRIIGGAWRSRRIRFPDRPGLRPTPDRVRETLFNWLGQDLTGRDCLDLFAGSGALGFEAASRGARRVTMVENDAAAWRALQDNREGLAATAVTAVRADALEFLKNHHDCYHVVFLDPPFADDLWPQLLARLPRQLASGGLVYCERAQPLAALDGWEVVKSGRAGQVSHQLLKRVENE